MLIGMLAAAVLATAQTASGRPAGTQAVPNRPRVETKACPDGSVVLKTDTCIQMPDHRFLHSRRPANMILSSRWHCPNQKTSFEAAIRITERPFVDDQGNKLSNYAFDVELVSARMSGRQVAERTMGKIREALKQFNTISLFQGRCLFTPRRIWMPTLWIQGFGLGDGKPTRVEIELH